MKSNISKSEMMKAIKEFHRVYYEYEEGRDWLMHLHHAAEDLFNAAEINISICSPGANEPFLEDAAKGLEPAKELKSAWDKIERYHSGNSEIK